MINKFYPALLILSGFCIGMLYSNINKRSQLDQFYFDQFKSIKSRLIYGSTVDSKKALEDFEDQTEFYMHLDGYNGVEILAIKCKALIEASQEKMSGN